MRGKKNTPFPSSSRRHNSLESEITDRTTNNPAIDKIRKSPSNSGNKKAIVDPPFKSPGKKWSFAEWMNQLPTIWKYFASFCIVAASAVWYMSKLDSNVNTLMIDVQDVKKQTRELERTSIVHSEKLHGLEKTISTKSAELSSNPANK